MSTSLRPISYGVMALVGHGGASGPELTEMATGGGELFWTGAATHVLRVARRLAQEGYLTTRIEAGKTRPRTVFALTATGHEAMRAWLAEPSSFPRIQNEAAVRLFASDLGSRADVLASLRALRDDLPRLEALCDTFGERAEAIPHRTQTTILELSLARRIIQAHREWVDEVEAALADETNPSPPRRGAPEAGRPTPSAGAERSA